jgi:hypothetical protein
VVFPGFADFTLVLLNHLVQQLQLPLVQSLEVAKASVGSSQNFASQSADST